MSRRPTAGIADYVVIAITPALIMLLVGSLIFFLLTTMYDGNFGGRLRYVAALFIFAAVLVARISIEEGNEHALLFGFPLAGATLLALLRFTDAPLLAVVGIIALIWWAAHQLTWDCTVLEESRAISGAGLLASAGFADRDSATEANPPAAAGTQHAPVMDIRDSGTAAGLRGWWHTWLAKRRRPHDPGVAIVYFVLATLPLIAIGQLALDGSHLGARRAAFRCLVVYVASGLGLLTTTSFLGIRRYLRARALAMPAEMATRWIAMSAALIVAILLLCFLLPRPQPEYRLAQLVRGSHEDLGSSRFAPLQHGGVPRQDGTLAKPQGNDNQRTMAGDNADQAERSSGESADAVRGASASSSAAPPSTDRDSTAARPAAARPPDSVHRPADRPASAREAGDSRARNASPEQDQFSTQAAGKTANSGRVEPRRRTGDVPRTSPSRPSEAPTAPRFEQLPRMIGQGVLGLLRWAYWAVVAAAVAFVLVRYWQVILAAVRQFWLDLCGLWASLWGSRSPKPPPAATQVEQPAETPARTFASFSNPFESNRRLPARQLVLYTFAALEAWGREHDCPRNPDQTAFEFARRLGGAYPELRSTIQKVADLYSRTMFAPDALGRVSTVPLESLWKQITSHPT